MRLFRWLSDFFAGSSNFPRSPLDEGININPATGLPMINPGMSGVDVAGNPFGQDLNRRDDHYVDRGRDDDPPGSISGFDHWSGTGAGGYDPFQEF